MKKRSICLAIVFISLYINLVAQDSKKPKNIILLIGDGMGVAQIYASMTSNIVSMNIERFSVIGFSKTYSANNYITDSGAGGTAIACGVKTINKTVGLDSLGKPAESILEYAEENGLATGLVSTSSLTHATPASFIAHQKNRDYNEKIALDFLNADIDVLIGGGRTFFETRSDRKNLLDTLRKRNYQVIFALDSISKITSGKLAGFTAKVHNLRASGGRGDMLVKSTRTALCVLKNNNKGFFLMVEGSMIDWGGHAKDLQYTIEELKDFDIAIGEALDFAKADGNTLVIVTADHETGGLSLTGGNVKTGSVKGLYASADHTGVMVPVFAFGPGAEKFAGIYQNTAIFDKMLDLYGFAKK